MPWRSGSTPETFTRRRALPEGLVLTEDEQRAFVGRRAVSRLRRKRPTWICERVELNALTAPQLVAYIEQRLAGRRGAGQNRAPGPHLKDTARELYRDGGGVAGAAGHCDALAHRRHHRPPARPLHGRRAPGQGAGVDGAGLHHDSAQWWRDAVRSKIDGLLWDQMDAITDAVRVALHEAIQDGALTAPEE